MSGARRTFAFALVVGSITIPATSAMAQIPGTVRVVNEPAPIRRWFRAPITDVLVMVDPGTTLDVLDKENDWYWVVAPADSHGTRRAGWIRTRQVEAVVTARAALAPRTPAGAARRNPTSDAAISLASAADDKVTITMTETPGTTAGVPASAYAFEDVHFDRDRHMVRPEDHDRLRAVVAALKADPRLTVNIEGYTCNLGSPAYNLALGVRRASAVRDYLVSQGVAGDRLHTVSLGEDKPKHDNASEETRRLNRRVALVPEAKR